MWGKVKSWALKKEVRVQHSVFTMVAVVGWGCKGTNWTQSESLCEGWRGDAWAPEYNQLTHCFEETTTVSKKRKILTFYKVENDKESSLAARQD